MLEISRKSWHYRLYRYISSVPKGPSYLLPGKTRDEVEPPKSLCPYSWAILLGVIGFVVIACAAVAVSPLLAFGYGITLIHERVSARKAKKPKKTRDVPPLREKKPSLLAATIRAKKEKVCPPIKLVD